MSQNGLNIRKYNIKTNQFDYIDKITVFSDKISYFSPLDRGKTEETRINDIFSRTDMAFGKGFTKKINNLTVTVVGAGGIGSIVSEGVARLGVKKIQLIDPDRIEATNLNRLQGASLKDVGKFKVDVMKGNLEKYFNYLKVDIFKEDVMSETVVSALKETDVIIGSVDNHPTRFFLNRLSVQYLIPYIDAATRIIDDGNNTSITARVAVVIPSITSCMDCCYITYYDSKDIYFHFASDVVKNQLKNAGYIKGNDKVINPAVYPQNLAVSSLLLMELMNIIAPYKPLYNNVYFDYSKLYEIETPPKRIASTFIEARKQGKSFCLNCDEYLGKGDSVDVLSYVKPTGLEKR